MRQQQEKKRQILRLSQYPLRKAKDLLALNVLLVRLIRQLFE